MQTLDSVTFLLPFPTAQLGDRVALWVNFKADDGKNYLVRRCGTIIQVIGKSAVLVEDELVGDIEEPVWVGRDMIFVPGGDV